MELIISVLSLFIGKGGEGGGRISGDHSFFQEKRGGLVSANGVSKGD